MDGWMDGCVSFQPGIRLSLSGSRNFNFKVTDSVECAMVAAEPRVNLRPLLADP